MILTFLNNPGTEIDWNPRTGEGVQVKLTGRARLIAALEGEGAKTAARQPLTTLSARQGSLRARLEPVGLSASQGIRAGPDGGRRRHRHDGLLPDGR